MSFTVKLLLILIVNLYVTSYYIDEEKLCNSKCENISCLYQYMYCSNIMGKFNSYMRLLYQRHYTSMSHFNYTSRYGSLLVTIIPPVVN